MDLPADVGPMWATGDADLARLVATAEQRLIRGGRALLRRGGDPPRQSTTRASDVDDRQEG